MHQITGTYMRRQGHQNSYEYTATLYPSNGGFMWNATVRCEGKLKGSPSGRVVGASIDQVEQRVRSLVKDCIEDLVGVME